MKAKYNFKIPLTDTEKKNLRSNKIRINEISDFATDELEVLLAASPKRAKEISALIEFQIIPSIGIKFAEDLVSMGFYSIEELALKDGAKLIEEFEKQRGYWVDPCVEDQFRLVVHYANSNDRTKNWWDFTKERKQYRLENGYSKDRPRNAWQDDAEFSKNNK